MTYSSMKDYVGNHLFKTKSDPSVIESSIHSVIDKYVSFTDLVQHGVFLSDQNRVNNQSQLNSKIH